MVILTIVRVKKGTYEPGGHCTWYVCDLEYTIEHIIYIFMDPIVLITTFWLSI